MTRSGADKSTDVEKGATDYVAKPFPLEDLLARVRAPERRAGHRTDDSAQRDL